MKDRAHLGLALGYVAIPQLLELEAQACGAWATAPFPMQVFAPPPLTPATCACSGVMVLLSYSLQCLHVM
jgi:hypothetical protein